MKIYYLWPLAVLFAAMPANGEELLTLHQAEYMALKQNPTLATSRAQARALAEVPPQVGTLPDPHLSFKAINLPVDSFSTTQENMTQLQVGLSQAIPFPGKLSLKEEAAQHLAEASTLSSEEVRLRVLRNVRISWWNLFYLDRALEIVARNKELLRQFITIAQTKYKVGRGLQQDVLLAQVELSKLLDIEIRLQGTRRTEEARLNALLGRSTQLAIHLPGKVEETLPPAPPEERLHEIALQARPLLASRKEHISAARAQVDLAKKDYYPDFNIGAAYGFRQGVNPVNRVNRPDFASFGLSLNLPIFTSTKQDRALAQRKAEVAREEYALRDATEAVWSETSASLADYIRSRHQATLFKTGIIPQASQTVASMLAGYQVGKVDFLNLVRSQITLYNYETEYWKALASARQSMARLEAAVGKEISRE